MVKPISGYYSGPQCPMNTSSTLIADKRRAASNRLHFILNGLAIALIVACFLFAGRVDFTELLQREQANADLACRSAGASFAVRLEANGAPVFVCNAPVAAKLARRAI